MGWIRSAPSEKYLRSKRHETRFYLEMTYLRNQFIYFPSSILLIHPTKKSFISQKNELKRFLMWKKQMFLNQSYPPATDGFASPTLRTVSRQRNYGPRNIKISLWQIIILDLIFITAISLFKVELRTRTHQKVLWLCTTYVLIKLFQHII